METGLHAGSEPYAEDPGKDSLFRYNVGSVQSISVSRGQEDAILFNVNLEHDSQPPFEGGSAIGTYAVELPTSLPKFDYSTITDVVFHVGHTADGSGGFRSAGQNNLRSGLNQMILKTSQTGLVHAFDLRREQPDLWHRLISTSCDSVQLNRNWLTCFISSQGVSLNFLSLRLLVKLASGSGTPTIGWNGGQRFFESGRTKPFRIQLWSSASGNHIQLFHFTLNLLSRPAANP